MAAVFYDTLLLLAVLFFATALVLPFNGGQAFKSNQIYFPLYLLFVSYGYFAWFWTHGGQTLGLKAWKLKVCTPDGGCIGWQAATIRFSSALLSWVVIGLGFIWCLTDKNRQAWHDNLSGTRLLSVEEKR